MSDSAERTVAVEKTQADLGRIGLPSELLDLLLACPVRRYLRGGAEAIPQSEFLEVLPAVAVPEIYWGSLGFLIHHLSITASLFDAGAEGIALAIRALGRDRLERTGTQ